MELHIEQGGNLDKAGIPIGVVEGIVSIDEYDVEITEIHHRMKKDAPSGTAAKMAEVIAEALGRRIADAGVYGRHGLVGERTTKEIGVHALRGGDVVVEHTVVFSTAGERLELTHRAHSRDTFGQGALRAARFVAAAAEDMQKRPL